MSDKILSLVEDQGRAFEGFVQKNNDRISALEADITSLAKTAHRSFAGGLARKQIENYSISNVIRYLSDPKGASVDIGRELELHQELAGKSSGPDFGIHVPFEVFAKMQTKAVTVGGTGSNLVPTEYLENSLIDVLRNRSHVMQLGATVLDDLMGDVAIPKKTASVTAYWFAGDGSDTITASDPTISSVSLSPTFVGGLTGYSHKMLMQSSPAIERFLMDDLSATLAFALDAAALNGSGSGAEPTGILNTGSIGSTTYANGGSPSFANIVGLEGTLAEANTDAGQLGYVSAANLLATLKTTDVGTDTGRFIWSGGQMNGYAARHTGNMPDGYVLLGNWADLLIGIWGSGVLLAVDPSTNFASGSVRVRAILGCDIDVRHAESFAEIHEAAA